MDVYKIAVNLAVTSNASHFFAALSHQIAHVHTQVRDLHGSLNRVQVGLAGALSVGVGAGMIAGLKKVTDHARELSKELATLKTFNLSSKQIQEAQATARATTRAVPGSTESGNLKIIAESYSLFGFENAKRINETLARSAQVFGGIDGNYKGALEKVYSLLKSGEMMGKLVDHHTNLVDPGKLTKYIDIVAKVAAATGNKVNAQTLFGLAQQGGPALTNMTDDGLISMMMAAQSMGGMRAGTAMTALYQQFIGGTMTKDKATALHELGILGSFTSKKNSLQWKEKPADSEFAKLIVKNPLDAMQFLIKKMEEKGITSPEAQSKKLFEILGRQTTQRIVSDFVKNLPQMMEEQGRIKQAQGVNDQAKTRNAEDYGTAEHNMHSAWENLMEAIAGPQAKAAIGIMNQITGGLNTLTEAVRGTNPETIVAVAKGIGVLGAALIGAGAVALLAALGPAGWLTLGVGAGLGAWAAFDPTAFKSAMLAIKDGAIHAFGAVKSFVTDPAVIDKAVEFWRQIKAAGLSIYESVKEAALDPEVLRSVRTFWETTKQEAKAIYTSIKEMVQDPQSEKTVRGTLTTTMEEVKWILDWYKQIKGFLTGNAPEMKDGKPFDLKSLGINFNGDLIGQAATILRENLAALDKTVQDFLGRVGTEAITAMAKVGIAIGDGLRTIPGQLAGAIADFGSGLVTAIGDMLRGLVARLNPFSRTSFEGGGEGGLIHNASFGGTGGFTSGFNGSGFGGSGGGGFNGSGFGGRALGVGSGTGIGHAASQQERAAFIRATAASLGIDPEVALRVAQSEGFGKYVGDHGMSFGDFQLFTGGGLGNRALAAGINVRDPSTWQAQTVFALKHAKQFGWGSWYGARKVGIGNRQGLDYHGGDGGAGVGVINGQLRVKGGLGGQAFGGGPNHPGLQALAQMLQAPGGGVDRVTAFNDRYHAGTSSMHARGLAMDLTGNAARIMANARQVMEASGLVEGRDYKMLNEYAHRSRRWTGGHVHFQFNSRQAADAYSAAMAPKKAPVAGPPPPRSNVHQVTVPVTVGEHRLATVFHRVLSNSARHPTSAGGMDYHGHWRPPGTNLMDTA